MARLNWEDSGQQMSGTGGTTERQRLSMAQVVCDAPPIDVTFHPRDHLPAFDRFELEIGCGKGGFLLERARQCPDTGFLGIEWANKFYLYCADRMARWGMANVRVMRTDAGIFVQRQLVDACVDRLHLYHPDPWPKKRHQKRRIVQPAFVAAVARVLKPGGRWLIQTDHAAYFEHMQEVLAPCGAFRELDWEACAADQPAAFAGTNFEVKYRREGRRIYRLALELQA